MPNLSGLKNEIVLTDEIGVITNAMQLVATSKLQKMGKKVQATHEYLTEVYAIFNDIILQINDSPLLKKDNQEFKKTL
jgi:F-type H+-transporting ATPase subunit gamma